MADISLQTLYEQKSREFNVQGAGLTRFESDFLNATNRAINRINRDADLEDEISAVSGIEDTVTGLDEEYEDVLSDGISLYLCFAGQRPAKGAETQVGLLEARFVEGISSIFYKIINDVQNEDSDDETSIIGLGALG